ncbi:unnamed protein product [Paramecium sonneborni]|uniref:MORN repeat protein n=1 Tax=Paramecium sonneborni TaxID=65129 RepID=A0A8S1KTC8_9CILI|nr:unnamed protein product [Paramecium sonneborni]
MGQSCCSDYKIEKSKEINFTQQNPFNYVQQDNIKNQDYWQIQQNNELRLKLLKANIQTSKSTLKIPVINNVQVKETQQKLGEYMISTSISNEGIEITPPIQFDNGSVYVGGLKMDQFQGYGELYWEDGTHYCGQFNKGYKTGYGRLIYSDGDAYEGEWLENQIHGQGKYWYANGGEYEGRFVQDQKHGFGREKYVNGDIYEGEFYQGIKSGRGKLIMSHATVEGQFQQNEIIEGEYKWNDGRRYVGQFKESKMHGNGEFWFPDNQFYKGL